MTAMNSTATTARTVASVQRAETVMCEVGVEACDDGNDNVGDGCDRLCRIEACGLTSASTPAKSATTGTRMMTCARIGAEWQPAVTASCATTLRPVSKVMKPAMTVTGTTPTAAPTTASEHAAVMVFCGVTLPPGAPGYEACDDGNVVDQDACRTSCVQARCGDGVRRLDLRRG